MCIAIPSRVIKIENDNIALVEMDGIRQKISLMLVEDINVDDYVIVHAGFAIHKMDSNYAKETIELIKAANNDAGS